MEPVSLATADTGNSNQNSNATTAPVAQVATSGKSLAERISDAPLDFDQLEALTREFIDNERTLENAKPDKPAQATAEDQAAPAEPTPEAKPEGDNAEAADPATAEDDPENPETTSAEEPDGDASAKSGNKKGKGYRFRPLNAIEDRAYQIKAGNKFMGIEECLAQAKKEASGESASSPTPANAPQSSVSQDALSKSIDSIDAQIAALDAEDEKASTVEFDTAKSYQARKQIEALKRQRDKIQRDATQLDRESAQQQVVARQNYEATFAKSTAKALELYEFTSKPDSPEMKYLNELDAEMKANGDPLYFDADKPRILTQMTARKFNLPPRFKSSAVPAKPSVTRPASSAPPLAPAASRSSASSPQSREKQLLADLSAIPTDDILAIEEAERKLGLRK